MSISQHSSSIMPQYNPITRTTYDPMTRTTTEQDVSVSISYESEGEQRMNSSSYSPSESRTQRVGMVTDFTALGQTLQGVRNVKNRDEEPEELILGIDDSFSVSTLIGYLPPPLGMNLPPPIEERMGFSVRDKISLHEWEILEKEFE